MKMGRHPAGAAGLLDTQFYSNSGFCLYLISSTCLFTFPNKVKRSVHLNILSVNNSLVSSIQQAITQNSSSSTHILFIRLINRDTNQHFVSNKTVTRFITATKLKIKSYQQIDTLLNS
jgi:hypothetical protein